MAKFISIAALLALITHTQVASAPSLEKASVRMALGLVFAVALFAAARRWVTERIEG